MNFLAYVPQMAPFGGMERHVCGLCAALAARGHRVRLITTSKSLGAELRDQLLAAGVELRELARSRGQAGKFLKAAWLVLETLRAFPTRWDVIYTNGQSALARVPWLAARRSARIVHHHHTSADRSEQATWSRWFREVLRRAPEVIGCSRATRDAIAAAVGRSDIRFLPYLTACPIESQEVHDRRYSSDTPLHFGFTGRLVAEKGIDAICALSERPALAHITWHIYGQGPSYPAAFFERFRNIRYHGPYRGREQQAAALQSLDALVLFSTHNEGMPLSLIEGMSAGLPWIATDRGGTREIAVNSENCLVVTGAADHDALCAAALELSQRLRRGSVSRVAQRQIYDAMFAPATVTSAWCDYLEKGVHVTRWDNFSPVQQTSRVSTAKAGTTP